MIAPIERIARQLFAVEPLSLGDLLMRARIIREWSSASAGGKTVAEEIRDDRNR